MLVSAIDIVVQKRRLGERLQLVGDTLPKALQHKDDAFLDRCIMWRADDKTFSAAATNVTDLLGGLTTGTAVS